MLLSIYLRSRMIEVEVMSLLSCVCFSSEVIKTE